MRRMKAAEIILDYELYPRNNVDSVNVRSIMDALVAGEELPPVITDKRSKRCTDGFHRVTAVLRLYGENAEIDVIEKPYKNDAEMFQDAMRYNSQHGARLDACDRNRCVIIGERLGIPLDAIAGALHMPAGKLGELKNSRTALNAAGLSIPLKRTVSGFAGRKLTKRQVEANDKLSGMNQSFYANQLIELFESKMLDTEDENLMERLRVLHGYLEGVLVVA